MQKSLGEICCVVGRRSVSMIAMISSGLEGLELSSSSHVSSSIGPKIWEVLILKSLQYKHERYRTNRMRQRTPERK